MISTLFDLHQEPQHRLSGSALPGIMALFSLFMVHWDQSFLVISKYAWLYQRKMKGRDMEVARASSN